MVKDGLNYHNHIESAKDKKIKLPFMLYNKIREQSS